MLCCRATENATQTWADPTTPVRTGTFKPEPLGTVATEDPALTLGPDKVAMWSYPIISDGLVYVTDIRNGLYVLRYTGKHSKAVSDIEFLEGNSNLGDAAALESESAPASKIPAENVTVSAGISPYAEGGYLVTSAATESWWQRLLPW